MLGTGVKEFHRQVESFTYPIHNIQYLKPHFEMQKKCHTSNNIATMLFKLNINLESAQKRNMDVQERKVEKIKCHLFLNKAKLALGSILYKFI